MGLDFLSRLGPDLDAVLAASPDLPTLLAAAALVLSLVALALAVRARRRLRCDQGALQAIVGRLERDLGALCRSASKSGDRLVSLEQRSRELAVHQESGDTVRHPGHFRHAFALLERGASTDELVQTCGLAQGEAELVAYLHAADRPPDRRMGLGKLS